MAEKKVSVRRRRQIGNRSSEAHFGRSDLDGAMMKDRSSSPAARLRSIARIRFALDTLDRKP